jgi:hypothetical protein
MKARAERHEALASPSYGFFRSTLIHRSRDDLDLA